MGLVARETWNALFPADGSIGEGSTFPGSSSFHDSAFFAPIEREASMARLQQTFLVGYRFLCHEVFAKDTTGAGLAKALDVIDRGRSEGAQRRIRKLVGGDRTGILRGHEGKRRYQTQADDIVRSGEYPSGATLSLRSESCRSRVPGQRPFVRFAEEANPGPERLLVTWRR